ncbi:hypothetical protein [Paractinoplanes rishiriensis]|uniref:Uncharacterized protein n=1 Tax=Paractinoplanes rishiriensis TaxID=1050105 RepID=A0A919JU60_9ACTN|nr:hypothetical protein [Actinoplanes rishiriensis]GIE93417.1 hypothetical protein Ari01nite_08820 [Actinoplanes rishiriensis]
MTMYETSDLHKRVARYEAALDELRAAHQDIRNILHDQVLYDRWQQIGAELGFALAPQSAGQPQAAQPTGHQPTGQQQAGLQQDLGAMNQQIPQMSEAWAG